jgi:succinate dehydrogenase / fumarate reductase flavoprotein subunit
MFDYIPGVFKGQYAETEERPTSGSRTTTPRAARLTCCPRRGGAPSTPRVGGPRPRTVASTDRLRIPVEEVKPAAVDVPPVRAGQSASPRTNGVSPTATTSMGYRGRPDSGAATGPGLFAAGGCRAACTAPTGSAATRCRTCWCSAVAPDWVLPTTCGRLGGREVRARRRGRDADGACAVRRAPHPRERTLHAELQQSMNDLVGIIPEDEIRAA